jgi:hypothetical protein
MKKFFQLSTVLFGILMTQNGYSLDQATQTVNQTAPAAQQATVVQGARHFDAQPDRDYGNGGSDPACCGEQACGECYCLYVKYEPCYYTTKRCVEEQITCKKKCCRYVPQYCEVKRCRYVPQYYTETVCRQVPEYYYVDECKPCKKTICEKQCKYVPKYYWKHTCGQTQVAKPCCN